MTAWKVKLHGREIDTVFGYEGQTAEDVKRSLVNHDGYDSAIVVTKKRAVRPRKHLVWIKVPTFEAEVRSRHHSRRAAEVAAKKLERKWKGHHLGRVDVWVESPRTIEATLRSLKDKYEEPV
jgi:hypothetical protein